MTHIKKVEILGIRSLKQVELNFANLIGWHVVIGGSGSGKSTLVDMLSCPLLDKEADDINWSKYLSKKTTEGFVNITAKYATDNVMRKIVRLGKGLGASERVDCETFAYPTFHSLSYHSVFKYADAVVFLKHLCDIKLQFGDSKISGYVDLLMSFVNNSGLLPNSFSLSRVAFDDVYVSDAEGNEFPLSQAGAEVRFLIVLVVNLIRKLSLCYGMKKVFSFLKGGNRVIGLSGVAIIDDIDSFLSPIQQASIGYWFMKHFPKFQFIVTARNAFVCRASHNGTIWRLPTPATNETFQEVVGTDKMRMVYGDIMEAYLAVDDVFGDTITLGRSKEGQEKVQRLAKLNIKSIYNQEGLTEAETVEHEELKCLITRNIDL